MDLPEGRYSYNNIGVNIVGWHLEPVSEQILECPYDSDEADFDCDHDDSSCYYWDHDWIVTDFLEVVYVGDDTVHLVELEDLTLLEEGEEVCSCGMIGCWADNTDYE